MSTRCERAIDFTKADEGGYCNHHNDKGGPTNLGVTLKTLRTASANVLDHSFDKDGDGDVDVDDLKLLDSTDLEAIVRTQGYWYPALDQINSEPVAIKTFNFGFNCGPTSGAKLLQQAVNRVCGKPTLVEDGKIGPRSLVVINAIPGDLLLKHLIQVAKAHYVDIVQHDPSQSVFLKGWLNRAERMPS